MARYALIFLAAALLCTAVLAQDATPAHRGGTRDTYSTFDTASQRYRPVSNDTASEKGASRASSVGSTICVQMGRSIEHKAVANEHPPSL
jgi:hypothetical protein